MGTFHYKNTTKPWLDMHHMLPSNDVLFISEKLNSWATYLNHSLTNIMNPMCHTIFKVWFWSFWCLDSAWIFQLFLVPCISWFVMSVSNVNKPMTNGCQSSFVFIIIKLSYHSQTILARCFVYYSKPLSRRQKSVQDWQSNKT